MYCYRLKMKNKNYLFLLTVQEASERERTKTSVTKTDQNSARKYVTVRDKEGMHNFSIIYRSRKRAQLFFLCSPFVRLARHVYFFPKR